MRKMLMLVDREEISRGLAESLEYNECFDWLNLPSTCDAHAAKRPALRVSAYQSGSSITTESSVHWPHGCGLRKWVRRKHSAPPVTCG